MEFRVGDPKRGIVGERGFKPGSQHPEGELGFISLKKGGIERKRRLKSREHLLNQKRGGDIDLW